MTALIGARKAVLLGGVPGWVIGRNAALRDVDLKGNRYWQGATKPAVTDLLTTARSSTHLLADTSGVYQSFGNNVLARNDNVGAYVGGQVTNIVSSPNDLNTASWVKLNGATVAADGDFWAVTDANAAALSELRQDGTIPADTLLRTFWVDLKKDTENTVIRRVYFDVRNPTYVQSFVLINTSTGAWQQFLGTGGSVRDLGDRWRVIWSVTNVNDTGYRIYLSPAFNTNINSDTTNGTLLGTASFSWPHFVLGGYPGDNFRVNGTRLASDVTSANMAWFAPLDGVGATEIIVPKWNHVGDGVDRTMFQYIKDASNYIRGYVNASDKPALKIVSGGATQTDTALTTAITTGRKPLAFGWSASGGYIGDAAGNVVTFGAVTLPSGLSSDKWGSSQAGNYLNDILERRVTLKNLSQSQALSLAATA